MNEVANWTVVFTDSLRAFGEQFVGAIPAILGALIILLLGWLIAKVISWGIARGLSALKFDALATRFHFDAMLEKAGVRTTPSRLIGRFAYWLLLLLVILTAADTLGWTSLSREISNLLSLLPELFVASIFLIVGLYIAGFVRDVIAGATASLSISSGRLLSAGIYYLLVIVVTLTALDQANIDISIITNNLMLILGAILLAASLSYGLASREALSNILASYFAKNLYKVGQTIEIEGTKGTIEAITSIALIVRTDEGKEVIPTQHLMQQKVRIVE